MFKRKKRKFQPEIFRESVDAISNPGCGWYHLYTFDAADLDAPLYVACPEEELVLLRISVRSAREREISGAELKNIARILQFFRDEQKGMACTIFGTKTGNPCIFSREYYQELMEITGDKGGKQIINRHPEDVTYFKIEDARELQDIDIPLG